MMPTPPPNARASLAPWELLLIKLMISGGVGVVSGIAAAQAGMRQQDAGALGFILGGLCALLLLGGFSTTPAPAVTAPPAPKRPAPLPEVPPPQSSTAPHSLSDSHAVTTLHHQLVLDYVSPGAVKNHPGRAGSSSITAQPEPSPAAAVRAAAPPHFSSHTRPATARAPAKPLPSVPRRAREPSGIFDPADWDEQSFLRRMGYHVGVSGPLAWQRQDILRRAYERLLPTDMPAAVRSAYGAPQSTARLQRIVSHRQGRISLAEKRTANMSQAINHWRADINWLQETYGSLHGGVNFSGRR